jgi:tetratricopeptide (TPR) repeat protein
MPKISDLAAKNPDIIFIGQNVWDKDDKLVEPYVTKIGDLMKYRVAMDDKTTNPVGVMATTWINATGRTSIPTSIVVKDQKIAFIGHPAELDEVLPLIVAGTYDDAKYQAAQAERAKADREKAILEKLKAERKFEADHPGFAEAREKYDAAIKAKDLDAVISARKEITTIDAKRGDDLLFGEFYLAIQNDRNDIVLADAKPLIAENEKNYPMLNTVAGGIVRMKNPSRENVELALDASNKAVQMTQSKASAVMDVNARLLALHGEWDKAIEEGNKVIELNTVESFKPIYAEHLESYKNKQITHRELR